MSVATSVIVPSVTGAARLPRLLASLSHGDEAVRTIVVDNGSADAEVTAACRGFEFAEPLRLAENVGFARAVNRAARETRAESIVLVNDDCVCDEGFVERLASCLDPGRGVVMAAGVLRSASDESLIDTAGIEIDPTLLAFDYLNGEPVSVLDQGPADPIGPCAGAAAYDRTTFLELGGFDEALFAYWEDVDLALRIQRAGGTCALATDAGGVHAHSSTLLPGSARKNYLMGFGRGYVMRKWSATSPLRVSQAIARDIPVCLGQLVLDRSLAGVRGRIRGLTSAEPEQRYPRDILATHSTPGLAASLWRRARRKWRTTRSTMLES